MRTIAKSFLALALAAAPAFAQTGPIQGTADVGPFQFLINSTLSSDNTPGDRQQGVNGFVSSGSITMNTAPDPTIIGISRFFCIDDNSVIPVPSFTEVWITRLDALDFSQTKTGIQSRYLNAASMAAAITTGDDAFNRNQQRNMWRVMDGVATIDAPTMVAFDPTKWYVITGRGPNAGQQELLATVVPEPSTYALLATGLVALGVAARRRRRA